MTMKRLDVDHPTTPMTETFVCYYCKVDIMKEEVVFCDVCHAPLCKECWADEYAQYEHHDGRCVGAPSRYS